MCARRSQSSPIRPPICPYLHIPFPAFIRCHPSTRHPHHPPIHLPTESSIPHPKPVYPSIYHLPTSSTTHPSIHHPRDISIPPSSKQLIHPYIYLPFVLPPDCSSTHPSIHLTSHSFIHILPSYVHSSTIHPSIHPLNHLPIYPPAHLLPSTSTYSATCPSMHLHPSTHPPVLSQIHPSKVICEHKPACSRCAGKDHRTWPVCCLQSAVDSARVTRNWNWKRPQNRACSILPIMPREKQDWADGDKREHNHS